MLVQRGVADDCPTRGVHKHLHFTFLRHVRRHVDCFGARARSVRAPLRLRLPSALVRSARRRRHRQRQRSRPVTIRSASISAIPCSRAGVIPTPYGGVPPELLPCPAWGDQRPEDRGWVRGALKTYSVNTYSTYSKPPLREHIFYSTRGERDASTQHTYTCRHTTDTCTACASDTLAHSLSHIAAFTQRHCIAAAAISLLRCSLPRRRSPRPRTHQCPSPCHPTSPQPACSRHSLQLALKVQRLVRIHTLVGDGVPHRRARRSLDRAVQSRTSCAPPRRHRLAARAHETRSMRG